MMEKIKKIFAYARQEGDAAAIQLRCGMRSVVTDTRGESQNTSSAGFVIVSLLVIALVVAFSTGFAQNTFFPWVQSKFHSIAGS